MYDTHISGSGNFEGDPRKAANGLLEGPNMLGGAQARPQTAVP